MTAARLELPDLEATRRLAARLARCLRRGDLVALEGELGSGKTAFARALIRDLAGAEIEVPSPSFTLVQRYELPGITVTHADLYRLASPGDLLDLDLEEALEEGALLVEWPERAGELLPADRLCLRFAFLPGRGEQAREVRIAAGPSWRDRLASLTADDDDAR